MPYTPMKLRTLFLVLFTIILTAGTMNLNAAKLVVRDMKLLPTDQTATNPETMKKDQSGKTSALLKIRTPGINIDETYFDNGIMGIMGRMNKSGEIWLYIPARTQRIKVLNHRYEPFEWWMSEEIKSGKTYSAILCAEGKEMTISASVDGVPIYIDNEFIGLSPQTTYLSYGEHYIVADQQPMYGEKTLLITPESPAFIEIAMEDQNLRYSDVTITSPDGAEIWFEGKPAGQGSFKTRLMTGNYTAELRKPEHEPALVQFTANAGTPTNVNGPRLQPSTGLLSVTVIPPTKTMIMSGDSVVALHRLDKSLPIGQHTFTFSRKGYLTETRTFELVRNEKTTDTVTLKRVPIIRPNVVHFGAGYGISSSGMSGASLNLGCTYRNIDLDLGYHYKCSYPDYMSNEISVKGGRQFSIKRIGFTPQLGYVIQRLKHDGYCDGFRADDETYYIADCGKYEGAVCHNLSLGCRLEYAFTRFWGLYITPEYYIPIGSNSLYKEISKTKEFDELDYWVEGIINSKSVGKFYVELGLIFKIGLPSK